MGFLDEMKKTLVEKSPELAAKTASLMDKAKALAADATERAAPVLKEASARATAFAQEKSPVLKAQARKAIDDAMARRAALLERSRNDRAAYAEYQRTMYEVTLPADSPEFINEHFHHYGKYLSFVCVSGEVLETEKRAELNVSASHHVNASSGGLIWDGYGGFSADVSASAYFDASTSTVHEFWLRLADGSERAFYLPDSQIPLRRGQHVSLIIGGLKDTSRGALLALMNHNANMFWHVMTAEQINRYFAIDTQQPGFFNGQEVRARQARLLNELISRIELLCAWAATHAAPRLEARPADDE